MLSRSIFNSIYHRAKAYFLFFTLLLSVQFVSAQEISIERSKTLLNNSNTSLQEIDQYLNDIISFYDVNRDSALIELSNFIEVATSNRNLYATAEAYNAQGLLYYYQADFEKAIEWYEKTVEITKKTQLTGNLRRAYQGIGIANEELGRTRLALEFYFQTLKIAESVADTISMADAYNNIGSVYMGIKDFDEAAINYEYAIELMKGKENDPNYPVYLYNLGTTYENRRDSSGYEKALYYYSEALKLDSLQKNTFGLAYDYFSIGEMNNKMKSYEVAYSALHTALTLSQTNDNTLLDSKIMRQLADLHYARNNLDSALYYAEMSYAQSVLVQNLEVQKESARILSQIYEESGKILEANTKLREYVRLSEELINQDKIKAITRMEAEFDFDRERQQSQKFQQLTYLVLALFVLLLIVTAYFLYNREQYNKQLILLSDELSYLNQNLEKEVENRTKDLKQRTEQIEELAFINSHTLRHSLSQIIGLTQLLENLDILEPEEQQELINHINTAANRMDDTVRDMDDKMSLTKKTKDHPE